MEKQEPLNVGADMIAGSLIKNPGGGLVSVGGYIVGSEKNIKKVAARLTSPGIALEVGANLGVIRSYLQGLFIASKVTSGAIKGAILAAKVFESIGYRVFPGVDDERSDIIQAVVLGSSEKFVHIVEEYKVRLLLIHLLLLSLGICLDMMIRLLWRQETSLKVLRLSLVPMHQ